MILEQNIKLKEALQESVALIRQRVPYHDYNKIKEWETLTDVASRNKLKIRDVLQIIMEVWMQHPSVDKLFSQIHYKKNEHNFIRLLKSKSRKQPLPLVRATFYYYERKIHHTPLKSLGKYMGSRDHSTAIHGIQLWTDLIKFDKELKELDNNFKRIFGL